MELERIQRRAAKMNKRSAKHNQCAKPEKMAYEAV